MTECYINENRAVNRASTLIVQREAFERLPHPPESADQVWGSPHDGDLAGDDRYSLLLHPDGNPPRKFSLFRMAH
jgi:hypothetical protein